MTLLVNSLNNQVIPLYNANAFETTMQKRGISDTLFSFLTFQDCARLQPTCRSFKALTAPLLYDSRDFLEDNSPPINDLYSQEKEARLKAKDLKKAMLDQVKFYQGQIKELREKLNARQQTWRGWFVSKINVPSGFLSVIGCLFKCLCSCIRDEMQQQNALLDRISLLKEEDLEKYNEALGKFNNADSLHLEAVLDYDDAIKKRKAWEPLVNLFGNIKIFKQLTTNCGEVSEHFGGGDDFIPSHTERVLRGRVKHVRSCIIRGKNYRTDFLAFRYIIREDKEITETGLHIISFKHARHTRYTFTAHPSLPGISIYHNEDFFSHYYYSDAIKNSTPYRILRQTVQMIHRLYRETNKNYALELPYSPSQNNSEIDQKHSKEKEEKSKESPLPFAIPLSISRPSYFVEELFGGLKQYKQIPIPESLTYLNPVTFDSNNEKCRYFLIRIDDWNDGCGNTCDVFAIAMQDEKPSLDDKVIFISHIGHPALNNTVIDNFPDFWKKLSLLRPKIVDPPDCLKELYSLRPEMERLTFTDDPPGCWRRGEDYRGKSRLCIDENHYILKQNWKPNARKNFQNFMHHLKEYLSVQKRGFDNIGPIPKHIVQLLMQ